MRRLTAGTLRAVLPGDPDVEVLETGCGYKRVNASWPDSGAKFKIDVYRDRVEWKNLDTGAHPDPDGRIVGGRRNLYAELCAVLPGFFADTGRKFMVMRPRDDTAKRRLLRHGHWQPHDDGYYRWELDAGP